MRKKRDSAGKYPLSGLAIYSVLKTILPEGVARVLAGYSPNTRLGKGNAGTDRYSMTVSQIRERLSDIPGLVSYIDQVAKLVECRDGALREGDRDGFLGATREINKMQGYLAPLKMEVENRVKISGAVLELKAIMGQTGLTPDLVRREQERRKVVAAERSKEIEFREVLDPLVMTETALGPVEVKR